MVELNFGSLDPVAEQARAAVSRHALEAGITLADFAAQQRFDIGASLKVIQRIGKLSESPRPPGCKKLTGVDAYRVRQGNYRILYTIDDGIRVVAVYAVRDRKVAYRD